MVFAHAGLIFVEHDVQRPVQRVFDSPVGAYRSGNLPGIGGQTADEKRRSQLIFPLMSRVSSIMAMLVKPHHCGLCSSQSIWLLTTHLRDSTRPCPASDSL
ncbi:hypothetical protein LP417_34590 (plasmid) [Polaromonas sp. P1-6]|nr:hypothetical protein LP417_34590 [Polaromonas sp. P1-6]